MSISNLFTRLMGGSSLPAIEHDDMIKACEGNDFHIVDVREPNEFASGHVPKAKNHPLSRFDAAALPQDKPVILICQAGGRSAKALQNALSTGRTDIAHYAGGTGGWKARGGKIVM